MKLRQTLSTAAMLSAVLIFSGCSEDDPVDVRDQAMGTYNYTMDIYVLNGSSLIPLELQETGTVIASKTAQGFEVKEGGEIAFVGSKIAEASNGFTFDIETQTVDVDGQTVTVEGYDGVELGSVKYNGFYDSSKKELIGYFQFDAILEVEGDEFEVTIVIKFTGKKA